ncbi:hypothetical protein D3C74_249010 [compost metagenome]
MTFARRKLGDVIFLSLGLNPPHPSLTVREGVRGPAALWAPANWRNVGGKEALQLAVPFGDALYFGVWNAFPPFGVRLTVEHPGYLVNRAAHDYCCRRTQGDVEVGAASRPFGARLYFRAPPMRERLRRKRRVRFAVVEKLHARRALSLRDALTLEQNGESGCFEGIEE